MTLFLLHMLYALNNMSFHNCMDLKDMVCLYISCGLYNGAVIILIIWYQMAEGLMNWKGCGR
jgi:hypothetical protein